MDYLDRIEMPMDTRAYNKTKGLYHGLELNTVRGIKPNKVRSGFHQGSCYQRSHRRHYIKHKGNMFPLSVTVTLPVSHTTSKTFGDISKNGLFFIGGRGALKLEVRTAYCII